jgi:hypothetical protein
MSSQWGHGFHSGTEKGIARGLEIGAAAGGFSVAEHAWHCVNAAVASLEQGNDCQALGILRVMQFMLADSTGRKIGGIHAPQKGEQT